MLRINKTATFRLGPANTIIRRPRQCPGIAPANLLWPSRYNSF